MTTPNHRIPLSVPAVLGNEARYLAECVETAWVSSRGAFVDRFEADLARLTGRRHAIACVNGTAALHLALVVAGVEPDDEVLVSDLTFVASGHAIRYCGAWPVFIDAEPRYWQMDVEKLAAFLAGECVTRGGRLVNRATGRRVRAILPVHILGHPVDMAPVLELARRYGLVVVADAAEALGSAYQGKPAAAFGDLATLSFNGNKIVTTGGGGAVVTDDDALAARARYLSTQAKDDEREYTHGAVGYNYRLTNLQAAFGVAQLERFDHCLARKRATAAFYREALAGVAVTLPDEAPWAGSTWWLYTVLVDEARFGMTRRDLMARLDEAGIETRPLWTPLSRQRSLAGCQAYHCDRSAELQRRSISLPSSVGIEPADLERVVATLAGLAAAPAVPPEAHGG
ncbi:MAG: LegC family aminotransferase [Vicinamibacterales bacterium]